RKFLVWNSVLLRSGAKRHQISQTDLLIHGIAFSFVTENIASVTNWQVEAAEHTLIVHRAGNLQSLDIDFEHGPSARTLPRVGDIWAIPAGLHCAARALGQTI